MVTYGSGTFESAIRYLEYWGLTDVLLPFLLIFTVVFAILQKVNIFGKGKKNFNVIVSLVMSLSVVIPHVTGRYPAGADVVEIMNKALPNVLLVIILIITVFILIGMFGFEANWISSGTAGGVVVLAFIVVVWIFGYAAGWFRYFPSWLLNSRTQSLIIIILVFGLLIWWITRDSNDGDAAKGVAHIGKGLADLFQPKK